MRRMPRTRAVFGLAMGNLAVGTAAFSVVGVLPMIARALHIGEDRTSLVFSLYAASYAISSPVAVAVSGRFSRRGVAIAALTLIAAAAIGSALATNFAILAFARVCAAIGGGLFTPLAAAVAFAISDPAQRGRTLALVFFGFQLSQAAGVPGGVILAERFGWQAAFLLSAVLALIAILLLAAGLPARIATPVPSPRQLATAMTDRRMLLAATVMALHSGGMLVVMAFIAILAERWGAHSGIVVLMFGLGGIGASLTAGTVIARLGAAGFRRIGIGAQVVLLPLFSLPFIGVVPHSGLLGWLVLAWAFLCSGVMIGQQFLLLTRYPDQGEIALSLNGTANYLGMAVGTALGAWAFGMAGSDSLGLTGAVVAAASLALSIADDRRSGRHFPRL